MNSVYSINYYKVAFKYKMKVTSITKMSRTEYNYFSTISMLNVNQIVLQIFYVGHQEIHTDFKSHHYYFKPTLLQLYYGTRTTPRYLKVAKIQILLNSSRETQNFLLQNRLYLLKSYKCRKL